MASHFYVRLKTLGISVKGQGIALELCLVKWFRQADNFGLRLKLYYFLM